MMPLTEEDKSEIAKLIVAAQTEAAAAASKAAEEQNKRLLAAIDGKVGEAIKKATPPKADDPPKDTPKDPATGTAGTDNAEIKRLQAQMDALKLQNEQQRKRAEDAEAARKSEALRTGVRDALTQAGADPKRVHLALAHFETSQAIRLSDAGVPSFVVKDQWGEQVVPAPDHAKKWLETEEGKWFLPPTGASGTGDKAGGTKRESGGPTGTAEGLVLGALAGLL